MMSGRQAGPLAVGSTTTVGAAASMAILLCVVRDPKRAAAGMPCFPWNMVPALTSWLGMVGFALPALWLLSLKFAAALAQARVDAINQAIEGLDVAACPAEDWEAQVRQPMIELARTTLPALTAFGPAIGMTFIGQIGAVLCVIPLAVLRGQSLGVEDKVTPLSGLILSLAFPLFAAVWPAENPSAR